MCMLGVLVLLFIINIPFPVYDVGSARVDETPTVKRQRCVKTKLT